MRTFILTIIAICTLSFATAQEGMKFQKGSWQEIKELAAKENKLIFVDFYTQWCGPCYNMAKNTFVLYSVGTFYNTNFINAKIDAENGEGIELAKKYGVRSYPTYMFIDPVSEKVVHQAGGNIPADVFIFTGESALNPKKTSVYLEEQRSAGNKDGEFLLDYANYCGSCYKKDNLKGAISELSALNGYSLENKAVWDLFIKYVQGRDNAYFIDLKTNTDKYRSMYCKEAVDAKLFAECSYVPDFAEWANLPDFNGKSFLMKKAQADAELKAKNYEKAAMLFEELMANPGDFAAELCRTLSFTARSNMYGEHPDYWHDKCLEIARYVAYNNPNRDEPNIHQVYANQLELKLKRDGKALSEPTSGAKEYSMRPADLKKKPSRK